jgi:hypothetical protein
MTSCRFQLTLQRQGLELAAVYRLHIRQRHDAPLVSRHLCAPFGQNSSYMFKNRKSADAFYRSCPAIVELPNAFTPVLRSSGFQISRQFRCLHYHIFFTTAGLNQIQ